jgi:hypothetical protein
MTGDSVQLFALLIHYMECSNNLSPCPRHTEHLLDAERVVKLCPHPEKRFYGTRGAAEAAAKDISLVVDAKPPHPYPCPCGRWHLATRRYSKNTPTAKLPPERKASKRRRWRLNRRARDRAVAAAALRVESEAS